MEFESHNHKNFVCFADDTTKEQVPVYEKEREKPKDQRTS